MCSTNLSALYTGIAYVIFAITAMISNLLAQRAVLFFYSDSFSLVIAILVGTAVGLVIKYLLDKNFIFKKSSAKGSFKGLTFILYSLTGILTTAIFWATEVIGYYYLDSHTGREVGAILGLTVGYLIKYNLDKKYTFRGNSDG